jgi:hypothetical protein
LDGDNEMLENDEYHIYGNAHFDDDSNADLTKAMHQLRRDDVEVRRVMRIKSVWMILGCSTVFGVEDWF